MANVLIIDDDRTMARMLAKLIHNIDHQAEFEVTLKAGLEKALTGRFDVVFLDVHMPDGNGLDALKRMRTLPDPPEVVIITGLAHPDGAELAIKNGAWDYIQKPLSPKKIILPIKRVLQYRDNLKSTAQIPIVLERGEIIGGGTKIEACLKQMARAANSEASVLITGETGTGKELFAKTLHANSRRRDGPLVAVDCGSLPETLVESVLFGHTKGAFTGADQAQPGLVKTADRGTLFLDEFCELGLTLQKSFLRVLQEKRFRPVGSRKEVESDFRLIAATNRNPDERVRQGLFRQDLLYRLRAINIHLPPLRERKEDIGKLVLHYTQRITDRFSAPRKGFSPELIDILSRYDWPGNVRELVNVLENSISNAGGEPILFPMHLPEPFRVTIARASVVAARNTPPENPAPQCDRPPPPPDTPGETPAYKDYRESVLANAEKIYFQRLLAATGGNIKEACRRSGLGRTRLYTLLKKYGLTRKS